MGGRLKHGVVSHSAAMSTLEFLKFIHLLAAAVWTGGLIVLSLLVPTMRKAGADIELLRATARQFGRITWTAMPVAIVTGVAQVHIGVWNWSFPPLHLKLGLVALAGGLALFHQFTARKFSPAVKGMFQGSIGLASIAVFAAAVLL
jgi:putative copper export protein